MPSPSDSAPRAIAYAYPWTLHAEGVDTALDALVDCGIDGIQLAFAYHVGSYLTPLSSVGAVDRGDLGALHFAALEARPAAWPVQPIVSPAGRDPERMRSILRAAERRGLPVVAWVVYLYNHALGRAYPELTVRDAFGVRNDAQLCPANPTVRAYARALTQAILALDTCAGFHAESLGYLAFDYGMLNRKAAVEPDADARALLGICFCRHCRSAARAAGVPVDELAESLEVRLRERLAQCPDAPPGRVFATAPDDDGARAALAGLYDVRRERVVSLHEEVFALARAAGATLGCSGAEQPTSGADASTVLALRPLVDESRVRVTPGMDVDDLRTAVAALRVGTRPGIPVYAAYQLGHFASGAEFARSVEAAGEAGVRHHRFYVHGTWSRRQLGWLRDARPLWAGSGAA